ncbi:ATP-binding protein [Streptomyces sp. NPDC005728]|uniref:ATP-binding protein n=1 Tax=Streptomyces sp. NPDC005728 TaxID=3157054 RepID=UPI0033FB5255
MNAVPECTIPRHAATFFRDAGSVSASLAFHAALSAPRQARAFTREALRRWGEGEETIDAAVLIVCELATNAIQHGVQLPPDGHGREHAPQSERPSESVITLTLALHPDVLHIEVHDASPVQPVQRAAAGEDIRGRGLVIIATLASWTSGLKPGGGKWVRASLPRGTETRTGRPMAA